jgi:hypothetical protein
MIKQVNLDSPLEVCLTFCPQFSTEWPAIKIYENDQLVLDQIITNTNPQCRFTLDLAQEQNQLIIHYYNKSQHHTVVDNNGYITSDQSLEITTMHVNDILMNSWMLSEGHYRPDYFPDFIQQKPNAPTQLQSQLIWHFPGNFSFATLPSKKNFWWWYRQQRRFVHVKTHQGKDDYRDEAYIGSLDSHQDLIDEIKQIINV